MKILMKRLYKLVLSTLCSHSISTSHFAIISASTAHFLWYQRMMTPSRSEAWKRWSKNTSNLWLRSIKIGHKN